MSVRFAAIMEEDVMGPATKPGDEIFFDAEAGDGNIVLAFEDWVELGRPDRVAVIIEAAVMDNA